MTDRHQNYPDSTGARWDGTASGRRPASTDRPAFLDRTEPMSQQERDAHSPDGALDSAPGSTSRLPSQSRPDAAPLPQQSDPAAPISQQWQMSAPAELGGDPELAAASGFDPGTDNRTPPPAAAVPQQQIPPHATTPPPAVHQQQAAEPATNLNEPTQLHNPVSAPSQQRGRAYPSQVADGVYKRSRPGLSAAVVFGAIAVAVVIVYMMLRTFASNQYDPSVMVSGSFALAGLPLTVSGLLPLLGGGPGPEDRNAILRAPYVLLATGLVLLLAAGMAA
ncbi:MAG TPA: hypothetical protein VE172_10655 [Stackebrandtia sp.]|jgi:hypothetical protein|uniref:hypothetical protein n=1 Tax=Stackebrandtia sp. TaxID=2023065 RepID=UPI002D22CC2B|nr:hypothetical protein [Stackebrandtia sp.]HZE39260.1 hypothetical protein [Stackebrandtia sp.]